MSPVAFSALLFIIASAGGFLGALAGIGGGIIVVPALTLLFGIDIHLAVGVSIVCVIATSTAAAAAYVREGMTNVRVGMFLETGTVTGALAGAVLGGIIPHGLLFVLFGGIVGYSALMMLRQVRKGIVKVYVAGDRVSERLKLDGSYYDRAAGKVVEYRVAHPILGWCFMVVAGVVSALLGIGSGSLKVPVMDIAMKLPVKVSSSTSNFMIGVTAAASSMVYYARGDINPFLAAPTAVGITLGALVGARVMTKMHSRTLRILFVCLFVFIGLQMIWKGVGMI
jgi:uncharacterized membrane protein YfcA